MNREDIKKYAKIIYEYLSRQKDGYITTTAEVIKKLGIETDEFQDDWDIHMELFRIDEESNTKILENYYEDDELLIGLPFNYKYVVYRGK